MTAQPNAREAILSEYEISNSGIITSRGKFEGEMLYAPYFHALMADAADHYGDALFCLTPEDVALFPELAGIDAVVLREDANGYICLAEYESRELLETNVGRHA